MFFFKSILQVLSYHLTHIESMKKHLNFIKHKWSSMMSKYEYKLWYDILVNYLSNPLPLIVVQSGSWMKYLIFCGHNKLSVAFAQKIYLAGPSLTRDS